MSSNPEEGPTTKQKLLSELTWHVTSLLEEGMQEAEILDYVKDLITHYRIGGDEEG